MCKVLFCMLFAFYAVKNKLLYLKAKQVRCFGVERSGTESANMIGQGDGVRKHEKGNARAQPAYPKE